MCTNHCCFKAMMEKVNILNEGKVAKGNGLEISTPTKKVVSLVSKVVVDDMAKIHYITTV